MQELQDAFIKLRSEFDSLSQQFYKNNFSSHQDFTKSVNFSNRLKIPSYTTLPATCEVSEIAESGGVQYICSATDTWTVVGSQV